MAVVLQSTIRKYIGLSTDAKPRVGVAGADGVTPTAADLPAGSLFKETDTGDEYIWTGDGWMLADDPKAGLSDSSEQGELLLEVRAIRKGIELFLALERGMNIDLLTEEVTQLQES